MALYASNTSSLRHCAAVSTFLAFCLAGFVCPARAQDVPSSDRLKPLIDKIARGDEVESAAASERLVELVTRPVVEAIGSLEERPIEEQLRLRRTLSRLTGAIRLRVYRLDLTPADRDLFDSFIKAYPELAERLFDGDWRIRKAAVRQIPLEPNTGVGLALAAKINDEDAEVAEVALEAASALHDAVIARALTRYVQDATRAMQAGLYEPQEWELALAVAIIVQRSIDVIAAAEYRPGAPTVAAAFQHFGRTKYWDQANRAAVLRALGRLKDPQTAPVLLEHLDDGSFLRWRAMNPDKRATETLGDVALAALLKIFERTPEEFGLYVTEEDQTFAGYPTDDERNAGHRAFRIWYERSAIRSGGDRTSSGPTSAPASQP